MFDQNEIRRAVDLQQRSYRLLRWLADSVSSGLIRFEKAHAFTSLPDAAESWLAEHLENIPPDSRPGRDDLPDFSRLFSTYLLNSFDLDPQPGKRLYSPEAHCFCPLCSWLIVSPNLKTKKLTSSDKRRAHRMRADAIKQIAIDQKTELTDSQIESLLDDDLVRENASLVAYGFDLLQRLNGIANGPAVLALWRGFAWNRTGSPKNMFQLTADLIYNAENETIAQLNQYCGKTKR